MGWGQGKGKGAQPPQGKGKGKGGGSQPPGAGKGGHPPGGKGEIPFKRPSKKDRDRLVQLGLWPPPKGQGKNARTGPHPAEERGHARPPTPPPVRRRAPAERSPSTSRSRAPRQEGTDAEAPAAESPSQSSHSTELRRASPDQPRHQPEPSPTPPAEGGEADTDPMPVKQESTEEFSSGESSGEAAPLPPWPLLADSLHLTVDRVRRSNNRDFWLSNLGPTLWLDCFPTFKGSNLLGIGGTRAVYTSPTSDGKVWKIALKAEPSRHGIEQTIGQRLPGLCATQTRMVGTGQLTIRDFKTLEIEVLEVERLTLLPDQPSNLQVLHMFMVLAALVGAGIWVRDLNKKNWGVRPPNPHGPDQGPAEIVALDCGGWAFQDAPLGFPQRVRIASWWGWIEATTPEVAAWARGVVRTDHASPRRLAIAFRQRLLATDGGKEVLGTLVRQGVIIPSPSLNLCLPMTVNGVNSSGDWCFASIEDLEA